MGNDEPGYYKVEKEYWVDCQGFPGAWLTVSKEYHGRKSGPRKSNTSDNESEGKKDLILIGEEYEPTQDERDARGHQAIAQNTH